MDLPLELWVIVRDYMCVNDFLSLRGINKTTLYVVRNAVLRLDRNTDPFCAVTLLRGSHVKPLIRHRFVFEDGEQDSITRCLRGMTVCEGCLRVHSGISRQCWVMTASILIVLDVEITSLMSVDGQSRFIMDLYNDLRDTLSKRRHHRA
jgi:hypothetical protein